MKRRLAVACGLLLVVDLCVLATVPGMTGVVAVWLLCPFGWWAFYRLARWADRVGVWHPGEWSRHR